MTQATIGAAPADERRHQKWRWWKIALAYLVLAVVAVASIWLVDREAMRVQRRDLPQMNADVQDVHR